MFRRGRNPVSGHHYSGYMPYEHWRRKVPLNKAIVVGRLGKDPEIKQLPSGMAVCNFAVATSEKRTDGSGNQSESTEWHKIVAFGKTAEICAKYLQKGKEVLIEGRIQTRSWDDSTGVKRYTTEIIADHVKFLSGSSKAGERLDAPG